MSKIVLTIKEAADLLGISLNHCYRLAKSGGVPTCKLGRRIVVPVEALNHMLAERAQVQKSA